MSLGRIAETTGVGLVDHVKWLAARASPDAARRVSPARFLAFLVIATDGAVVAAAGAGAGAGAPELPGEPSGLGDARGCWTRLAVPKSASFRWPSRATRTFSALRSR